MIVYVVSVHGCVVGVYTTKSRAEKAINGSFPDSNVREDVAYPGNYRDTEGKVVADMWKIEVNANPINC